MDGRNPPAVAKRHKTYGDAEDAACDCCCSMPAEFSPRGKGCASLGHRGSAASPFLCLANQRKATPLPRKPLRFSGFPGVGRGGSCPHDRRARSLARPFGPFPGVPAMLGAARGATGRMPVTRWCAVAVGYSYATDYRPSTLWRRA